MRCGLGHHGADMEPMEMGDRLAKGREALAASDWEGARDVLDGLDDQEALDGLARAHWWLGDPAEAIAVRERAYAAFRATGEMDRAARIALWLAREYADVLGNDAASNGWQARATRIVEDLPEGSARGWLALARAHRAFEPEAMTELAREAMDVARAHADPDLEIRALARLSLALMMAGDVDEGVMRFDEAMAAATGGEATTPETIGETCCDGMIASELLGDSSRFEQWTSVIMDMWRRKRYGPLIAFCGSCCGELFAASGDVEGAEKELVGAIKMLHDGGHRSRCVHPAAKLAELRVAQGRYEEARRLLEGYEDLPESTRPRALLALASDDTAVAAALLERRLNAIGEDSLLSVPVLSLLAEVRVAKGDVEGARAIAARLTALAARSKQPRVDAEAARAAGRAGLLAGDPSARAQVERALDIFGRLRMPQESARTRLLLAECLAATEPEVAATEAHAALGTFEQLGATRHADAAAALLKRLGGPARTGPKAYGTLSKREQEVLALLAEGLSNPVIAARLYISTKTAEHHVSNILMKLGVRTRGEAAAIALRMTPSG